MLRDAQVHPDRHRSIRVRMGGFHAYFTALNREHQEAIIARTEHRL
jgi:formate C-acetyltransferase